ncbi:hypothetical protein BV25DRAFT_1736148 [Artomyces pyxidatus]|uniref:Uncharacterized protein n=1 Tax=Artomyces pyxidatus TaxID=48021 RepID=A0ACB8SI87_9AGAM|nr:hypothetical protein BV25DRAFT_1736148 [Artomyces pyxidatus]
MYRKSALHSTRLAVIGRAYLRLGGSGGEIVRRLVVTGRGYGGWQESRRYSPGTRVRYLRWTNEWSRDPDQPSVFWLAGAGKSAFANEVATRLHEECAIYSCFFFRRDSPDIALGPIQLLAYGLSFLPGLRLSCAICFSVPGTAWNSPPLQIARPLLGQIRLS